MIQKSKNAGPPESIKIAIRNFSVNIRQKSIAVEVQQVRYLHKTAVIVPIDVAQFPCRFFPVSA